MLTKAFIKSPVTKKLLGNRNLNIPENMEKMREKFLGMKAWADAHPQYQGKGK